MFHTRIAVSGLAALVCAALVPADEAAAQEGSFQGAYMGQKLPGATPEFFAEGLVNTPMDMHGQIVFTPDLTEAFWHPDQPKGLYCSRMVDGVWSAPREFSFVEGLMHDAPCYSADGQRLFFAAAVIGPSGMTESDRLYCVDRTNNGWTEARPVDSVFDAFSLHWQFSIAADGSIYFGGNPKEVKGGRSDIWLAPYANGRYGTPAKLPKAVDSEEGEFSPCIAPDGSYLVFNRIAFGPGGPPTMSLYVSFRTPDGSWSESLCLDSVLQGKGNDLNAKISPDGKYLFFIRRGGVKSGTYWVSTSVLDALRPGGK
jgi:hypothetical protein